MPEDSILDMANNIEPLYLDLQGLYRKWSRDGEDWSQKEAYREARAFAAHLAEAIESTPHVRGKYGPQDFDQAASEMIEEWKAQHRPSMGESREKWCPGSGSRGLLVRSNARLDRCSRCDAVFVKSGRMAIPLHKSDIGDVTLYYDRRGQPQYARRSQIDYYA